MKWTRRSFRHALIEDRGCLGFTYESQQAFSRQPWERSLALSQTKFEIEHQQGSVRFAVTQPKGLLGGIPTSADYERYQATVSQNLDWASALLEAWASRERPCPRNDVGAGLRPKGAPERFAVPPALAEKLRTAMATVDPSGSVGYLRAALDRFVAEHRAEFPPFTRIALKHGGRAFELYDSRDEEKAERLWKAWQR